MEVPRLSAPDSGALTKALDTAGCCVLEDLVPAATMDAIASELAEFRDVGSIGASEFEGDSTRRTGSPLPRSATFRSIATHPMVRAAGDHVLGHATTWRFSASEFIEIGPGQASQRLHRDQWKYDMVDFDFEIELMECGPSATSPKQTARPASFPEATDSAIENSFRPKTQFLP